MQPAIFVGPHGRQSVGTWRSDNSELLGWGLFFFFVRGVTQGQPDEPYLHAALVHTKGPVTGVWPATLPPPPTPRLSPTSSFALWCLVGCRTRLGCVIGGTASPLSTERLFDEGPCCTSLWFRSLQRAGPQLRFNFAEHMTQPLVNSLYF